MKTIWITILLCLITWPETGNAALPERFPLEGEIKIGHHQTVQDEADFIQYENRDGYSGIRLRAGGLEFHFPVHLVPTRMNPAAREFHDIVVRIRYGGSDGLEAQEISRYADLTVQMATIGAEQKPALRLNYYIYGAEISSAMTDMIFEVEPKREVIVEPNREVSTASENFGPEPQTPETVSSGRLVEQNPKPAGLPGGLSLERVPYSEIELISQEDAEDPDKVSEGEIPIDIHEFIEDEGTTLPAEANFLGGSGCSLSTISPGTGAPPWLLMLILGVPWVLRSKRN